MRGRIRIKGMCLFAALAACSGSAAAGGASWSEITLTNSFTPLENRVVSLGPGSSNPDLMVFSLWTTGTNMNHLGAFIVPHPWDGSGVTLTPDIDVGPLFGVGDICVLGVNQVLVPYVKFNGGNLDVFTAYFDGSSWTVAAVPQTSTDDYHSATCIPLQQGIFLMVLNDTDATIEYYRAPHPTSVELRGPITWSLDDLQDSLDFGGDPRSPFDGTPSPRATTRSSLFITGFDQEFASEVFAGDLDGYLLIGRHDGSDIDGSYLPRNYSSALGSEQDGDLPIQYDRGSGGTNGAVAWLAHNRSGTLELTRYGMEDPADDLVIPLGSINAGSLFPNFQGIAVAQAPDGRVYVLADKAWQVDTDLTVTQMTGYPFNGLGGAVSLEIPPDMSVGFAAGPGSQVLGILRQDLLFANDFE